MANSNGWGDGSANNAIGWGQGAVNNSNNWGDSHAKSWAGLTDIVGVTTDADAQAFITAAAITDPTQQVAIDTLVKSLKSNNLWTKMKAVYPFVGGTASAHKYNLKDPRDLDAAFRLVFNGGWTHSANGATPNGTNGYADTKCAPSQMTQNSISASIYSRTNLQGFGSIGAGSIGITNLTYINPRFTNDLYYAHANCLTGSDFVSGNSTNSQGSFLINRRSSTDILFYKNGALLNTAARTSTTPTTNAFYLGGANFPSALEYSARQLAFATIGDGLTDTEAANLYTAVQAFQTSLSRQV